MQIDEFTLPTPATFAETDLIAWLTVGFTIVPDAPIGPFAAERQAIESRLAANWSTTPIRWENVPFAETTAAYVALSLLTGDGRQVSLGDTPLHRHVGVIALQILVPESSGSSLARRYADTLAAIYRSAQFAAGTAMIQCRAPSLSPGDDRHGWYTLTLTVPYHRDLIY